MCSVRCWNEAPIDPPVRRIPQLFDDWKIRKAPVRWLVLVTRFGCPSQLLHHSGRQIWIKLGIYPIFPVIFYKYPFRTDWFRKKVFYFLPSLSERNNGDIVSVRRFPGKFSVASTSEWRRCLSLLLIMFITAFLRKFASAAFFCESM